MFRFQVRGNQAPCLCEIVGHTRRASFRAFFLKKFYLLFGGFVGVYLRLYENRNCIAALGFRGGEDAEEVTKPLRQSLDRPACLLVECTRVRAIELDHGVERPDQGSHEFAFTH